MPQDQTPPANLTDAQAAIWWIRSAKFTLGTAWEKAHGIAQSHEGERAFDAIHAALHRIEGDTSNAAYWDRRAGTDFGSLGPEKELERIEAEFNF